MPTNKFNSILASSQIKTFLFVTVIFLLFVSLSSLGLIRFVSDSPQTITVIGNSENDLNNQQATFSAGVTVKNPVKKVAVDELNSKAETIVAAIKAFGIESNDVRTTNYNIYEAEDYITNEKHWEASVSVEVTLRDVARASEFAMLLAGLDTTNIWGPNYMVDNAGIDETQLLKLAYDQAQTKAESIAKANGMTLGRATNIFENTSYGSYSPIAYEAKGMGGGGGGFEPGSTTISKSVTVTYELKRSFSLNLNLGF